MNRENKVAVITGASGGIGSSFASHLAAQQYDLLITSYEPEKLEQTATLLRAQYQVEVTTVVADFTVAEDITRLAGQLADLPRIDMLVNSAGYGEKALFYQEKMTAVQNLLSVHIGSTVRMVHAVLPAMIRQRSGNIIVVSSLAAFMPAPGSSIYASSKAFLNSFIESIHMEVHEEFGIKVQSLCPGLTQTEFHKNSNVEKSIRVKGVNLWMEVDEVVEASLKGLENGEVICIPGCINKAIKVLTPAVPRWLYYPLANKTSKKFK